MQLILLWSWEWLDLQQNVLFFYSWFWNRGISWPCCKEQSSVVAFNTRSDIKIRPFALFPSSPLKWATLKSLVFATVVVYAQTKRKYVHYSMTMVWHFYVFAVPQRSTGHVFVLFLGVWQVPTKYSRRTLWGVFFTTSQNQSRGNNRDGERRVYPSVGICHGLRLVRRKKEMACV